MTDIKEIQDSLITKYLATKATKTELYQDVRQEEDIQEGYYVNAGIRRYLYR